MLMKKFALAAASAMLVTTVAFAAGARPAYAAAKVDCDAVMNELNSGKHQKDVATDLEHDALPSPQMQAEGEGRGQGRYQDVDAGQERQRGGGARDGSAFARGGSFSDDEVGICASMRRGPSRLAMRRLHTPRESTTA